MLSVGNDEINFISCAGGAQQAPASTQIACNQIKYVLLS